MNLSRAILFLLGCIGSRLGITYLVKSNINLAYIMGYISILPALGFLIIFIFGLRKTGIETQGNPIWWNNLRPVHALSLMIFAYLAITGKFYS